MVSDGEVLMFLFSVVLVALIWMRWGYLCFTVNGLLRSSLTRNAALVTPVLAMGCLLAVLMVAASHDVKDSPLYLVFYVTLGAAWVGVVFVSAQLFGLSLRDDWLERSNPAAAIAGTGVLFGATAAFAGANIGDGPGFWVVLVCGMLSTGLLLLCWLVHVGLSGITDALSIDRSATAGVRFCALSIAIGSVAGRGAAGDWEGFFPAIEDFLHTSWTALPYAAIFGGVERVLDKPLGMQRSWMATTAIAALHAAYLTLVLGLAGPVQ